MVRCFLIFLAGVSLFGCVTNSGRAKTKEKWSSVLASTKFQDEKILYKQRMKGLDICWDIGVDDFLNGRGPQPSPDCLYFSSKMLVTIEGDGFLASKKTLRQADRNLKVLQVMDDGFIVRSPIVRNDQVIFIQKSDEQGIVDGSFLDLQGTWGLYRYVGTYKYKSLVGTNTVHAFRKTRKDEFKDTLSGITEYGAIKEFFIVNELWDHLEQGGH